MTDTDLSNQISAESARACEGDRFGPLHRLGRCRALPPVLHRSAWRHGWSSPPDELTYVALSNSWVIINVGGGPTDDKPAVTLETPRDPDRVSSFLNIRVRDIEAVYADWSAKGARVPDAAETSPVRDPLLHPRSRRSSDRGRADHGPRRRLGARPLAVEHVRRGDGRDLQPGPEGTVLTRFIVSDDVERSARFYTEVLGGTAVFSGEPTNVALSNGFIVINSGGGPTDDKPAVTLETPRDPDRVSSFLNIRVKDIEAVYAEWSARGANFLTPPKQHQYEIRCYIRDPDGHLIEVGQTTDPDGDWTPAHWPSSTAAAGSE